MESPHGLSGSILLVLLGLYKQTIEAIGTLFKDFRKKILFLLPIFLGFGTGVFLFSNIVNYLITNHEMYTRFTFLGLILGTIPFLYKEVKKNGFNSKFYILIVFSFILGITLFSNNNLFPVVVNPNLLQSFMLGIAVAISTIIPGIDGAVILSTLGLYNLYVSSIANLNFSILIPAVFGLIIGTLLISSIMNKLIQKYYTITFSIIFGLFLSIIPNILNENCYLSLNFNSFLSMGFLLVGFIISRSLENFKTQKKRS